MHSFKDYWAFNSILSSLRVTLPTRYFDFIHLYSTVSMSCVLIKLLQCRETACSLSKSHFFCFCFICLLSLSRVKHRWWHICSTVPIWISNSSGSINKHNNNTFPRLLDTTCFHSHLPHTHTSDVLTHNQHSLELSGTPRQLSAFCCCGIWMRGNIWMFASELVLSVT